MKPAQRIAAFRAERHDVLTVCARLTDDDWATPSMAKGWQVRDVIAHLGATSKLLITPAALPAMFGNTTERANENLVAQRANWPAPRVRDEYTRWSSRAATFLDIGARQPLSAIPLRVAELGWYPMRLTASMLTFDTYVHLRHDIAPALDTTPAPVTDARLAVVLEWMLAGLEQMQRDQYRWLDQPLALTLRGPGGGTWRIEPGRAGRLKVRPGTTERTAAHITAHTTNFPAWATTRIAWRDCDLTITGDAEQATLFLDTLNII